MTAIRYLRFVVGVFGPPTKTGCLYHTVQNLVEIDAVFSIICKLWYLTRLHNAYLRLENRGFGEHKPINGEQYQHNPQKHMHTRKDVIPHVCTHRQYRFKMGASQKDKLKSAEMSDPRGGRNLAIPISLACRLLLCMSSRDSACYATIKMRLKWKVIFFSGWYSERHAEARIHFPNGLYPLEGNKCPILPSPMPICLTSDSYTVIAS